MLNGWKLNQRCTCKEMKTAHCTTHALCDAKAGKLLKVSGITGGRHLCARMASMGIYPGVEMELLCAGCGSPCVIRVHGGTLSLGSGISENILVESVV